MNSENIQKLIELFGTLGASSKEAFLWFIILDFTKFFIGILLGLGIATMAYRLIRKAIGSEDQEKALMRLRDQANLGHGLLSKYDIDEVVKHYIEKEKSK
jgi:hypothetical protein